MILTFLFGGALGYITASSVEIVVSKIKRSSDELKELETVDSKLKDQEQKLESGIKSFSSNTISKEDLEKTVSEISKDLKLNYNKK